MTTSLDIKSSIVSLRRDFLNANAEAIPTTLHLSAADEIEMTKFLRDAGLLKERDELRTAFPRIMGMTVKWDHPGETMVSVE